MRENVVTVSFDANVAGQRLDVHSATISIGVDAIPKIELMVAPTTGRSPSPLKPAVVKPTISDFSDLYKDLAAKAESLKERGTVDITVKSAGYRKGEDHLTLKNWVLSSVGMSSVSATSAPYLSVALEHPICHLTKVGSIYEEPRSTKELAIAKSASQAISFMEVVDAVYSTVRDGDVMFYNTPADMPPVFRKSLGVGEFDPYLYLVEKPEELFMSHILGAKDKIASAIGRMVIPNSSGTSTWDMIHGMTGVLLLSITQDKDNNFTSDKLVLEPRKPWKSATITLDEEDCFSTEIPGMDNFKLVGVMARKPKIYFDLLTQGIWKCGNMDKTNAIFDVLYVPPGLDPQNASGRIMKTSFPTVLEQAFREDAPHGDWLTEGIMSLKGERKVGLSGALMAYCQAVYEISVGSMTMGTAQMALWFRDREGNLILPGNTCRFVSGEKTIYYGYIRNVTHTMSTEGGCCTAVGMSYVRPEAKLLVDGVPVIEDGDVNAAYGA